MLNRVFLGWNEPFVELVADWLLGQQESLEDCLILVPTGQSARHLKQRMAHQAGALLTPIFSTPGALMRIEDPDIAPEWLEKLAWQEILENKAPRESLESLFSASAIIEGEWANGLASEMVNLRRSLQENGLTLADVSRRLGTTAEGKRWEALGRIESMVDSWIQGQGMRSRSRLLKEGIQLPHGCSKIILAGITELPPLVARHILESSLPVISIIAAPERLQSLFSDIGTPSEAWSKQTVDWPSENGSVRITSDPRAQALEARRIIAEQATQAKDIALGCVDTGAGDHLADELGRAGWVTYHPATIVPTHGIRHWLRSWCDWLNQADLATVMDLLSLPESSALIEADAAIIAHDLARLRDRWMVIHPDDLRHQLKHGGHRSMKAQALEVIRACEKLERWRKLCLIGKPADAIRHLLDALNVDHDELAQIWQWVDEASELMNSSQRSLGFWIQLMLSDLPKPRAAPPSDRMLDVHGWLELMFHPGSHLVLCGLNEGKLPASGAEDPWLGESARKLLELNTSADRAARDGFLLQSMMQSRLSSGGRVDLLCTRNNEKGEPQLPSRLLLAGPPEDIASRVNILFKEIEPIDSKLRWHAEDKAKWQAPVGEPPQALNATSFSDYLSCPFRYYLKHVIRMQDSDPSRIEWNARDFGNVIHDILEAWGSDEAARALIKAEDIAHWLSQRLDLKVQSAFNHRIPLAIRIQLDSIRQRLKWFADKQSKLMEEGWKVIEVEHKFEIPIGESLVRAKIDRIDQNTESGELRIIDYKTGGGTDTTSSAHRIKQSARTNLPAHISEGDPALYTRNEGKKESSYLWKNLQLPLYASAIQRRDRQLAIPCYFKLGEAQHDVELRSWSDFDMIDLRAAEACAEWISGLIARQQFSPIAQKPRYDDFELLWCGRSCDEVMAPSTL